MHRVHSVLPYGPTIDGRDGLYDAIWRQHQVLKVNSAVRVLAAANVMGKLRRLGLLEAIDVPHPSSGALEVRRTCTMFDADNMVVVREGLFTPTALITFELFVSGASAAYITYHQSGGDLSELSADQLQSLGARLRSPEDALLTFELWSFTAIPFIDPFIGRWRLCMGCHAPANNGGESAAMLCTDCASCLSRRFPALLHTYMLLREAADVFPFDVLCCLMEAARWCW